MKYLCRKLHQIDLENDTKIHVFCKQCNKMFRKCDVFQFQVINGLCYQRQRNKPWMRKQVKLRDREYKKKYRAKLKNIRTSGSATNPQLLQLIENGSGPLVNSV